MKKSTIKISFAIVLMLASYGCIAYFYRWDLALMIYALFWANNIMTKIRTEWQLQKRLRSVKPL